MPKALLHADVFAERSYHTACNKNQDISFLMPEDNGYKHNNSVDNRNGSYDGDRDHYVIDNDHPGEKTEYNLS